MLEPPADAQPGMKVMLEDLPACTVPTKEINLNKKNNVWFAAQPVCILMIAKYSNAVGAPCGCKGRGCV